MNLIKIYLLFNKLLIILISKMSITEIRTKLQVRILYKYNQQDNILNEIKALSGVSLQKKLLALHKVEVNSLILINKIKEERTDIEEKQYLKEYNDLKLAYEVKYQEYHQQVKLKKKKFI